MSYTPGPWEQRDDKIVHNSEAGTLIVAKTGLSDRHQADARLIAAAPELLEALDKLTWLCAGVFDRPEQLEHLVQCRVVLTKATGDK